MRPVFEVQREGTSIVLWEGGVGHRIVFESEVLAMLQEDRLLADEKRFHAAKDSIGVHVIDSFGEQLSPWEYVRRTFKAWRSKAGQHLNIVVYENVLQRSQEEYW